VSLFANLWAKHPGGSFVCDEMVFSNQCAMRMGYALEESGISLVSENLERCSDYSMRFNDHIPGHIRSAQELANVFYWKPSLLGAAVRRKILMGSIDRNLEAFRRRQGMVFIMNGWGTTDHIDLWDGRTLGLRGAPDLASHYRLRGQQVWFWEL